jgi:hypothetical protein
MGPLLGGQSQPFGSKSLTHLENQIYNNIEDEDRAQQ